jgi:chromatin remodeling complex protein RSC6
LIRERKLPKRNKNFVLDDELATALGRKTIGFTTMGKTIEGLIKSPADLVGYDQYGNWLQDDDEDDEDVDEGSEAASSARPAKRGRSGSATGQPAGKRPRWGAILLRGDMAGLCGQEVTSRSQLIKWMWARIRTLNLQDPTDRRRIVYDPELAAVLGKTSGTMFSMNKHLTKVILGPAPEDRTGEAFHLLVPEVPGASDEAPAATEENGVSVGSSEAVDNSQ